jgi:hypothetical protein
MAIWKPASAVYQGGTQQIKSLYGKRVRLRLGVSLFDQPVRDVGQIGESRITIPPSTLGFVAHPNPDRDGLLIAFSKPFNKPVMTIDALMKSNQFLVIPVNSITFKMQFEVEC